MASNGETGGPPARSAVRLVIPGSRPGVIQPGRERILSTFISRWPNRLMHSPLGIGREAIRPRPFRQFGARRMAAGIVPREFPAANLTTPQHRRTRVTIRSTATSMAMVLGLLLLAGCTTMGSKTTPAPPSETFPLRVGDIVDTKSGRVIDFDALVTDLSKADVVFVGETHASDADHQIQAKIAQALFARRSSLVLALEMFPREAQGILDRYSRGELSQEAFLKEVDWEKTWGFPFALYQPILGWAAEKHLKIIGLNAPQEVVRKVSRGGLASLDANDRGRLAANFDLGNRGHRTQLEEEFSVHAKGSIRDFDAFYEAQLAWEETMAETLADVLRERKDSPPVVVLIGKGHIGGRFGVPERAVKRLAHKYRTVIPVPVDHPDTINDPRFADFVWITGKADRLPPGRLGVLVRARPSTEGLEVVSIHPESPADRAGIVVGDIILTADGEPLRDIGILHRIVAKSAGRLQLRIKRKNKTMDLPVILLPPTR
jgi:uncharacterized iron-regulated protein